MGIHELLKKKAALVEKEMSPLELVKEEIFSPTPPVEVVVTREVDVQTAAKIGNLVAHGLPDNAIAEALLLSAEQISAAKGMHEYKVALARQLAEQQQQAIDISMGWDKVEEIAVAAVLGSLAHRSDPQFALHAAYIANKAKRKTAASATRVIDASKAGNTIILTLNKNYVQKNEIVQIVAPVSNSHTLLPKKHSDVLTPQRVTEILGVKSKAQEVDELSDLLDQSGFVGVSPDLIDKD